MVPFAVEYGPLDGVCPNMVHPVSAVRILKSGSRFLALHELLNCPLFIDSERKQRTSHVGGTLLEPHNKQLDSLAGVGQFTQSTGAVAPCILIIHCGMMLDHNHVVKNGITIMVGKVTNNHLYILRLTNSHMFFLQFCK